MSEIKRYDEKQEKQVITWTKRIGRLQTWLYQKSGGRFGTTFFGGKVDVCLLTTTGRKSGQLRTVPLLFLPDGERTVVVGSRVGSNNHAIWYLNLLEDPNCTLQIGPNIDQCVAKQASDEEVQAYWPRLVAMYEGFDEYKARADDAGRKIPVIILEPINRFGVNA